MRYISSFIACCVLVALVCLAGCSRGKGGGAVAAANQMNTVELMTAAADSLSAGRTEEAGFLFFAGKMRFKIDMQVYPPVDQGADSPDVLVSALGFSIGQPIASALATDPVARTNTLKRVAGWVPTFNAGYDPGWKYQNPLQGNAVTTVVAATRQAIIEPMEMQVKLNENPEYRRLANELAAVIHDIQELETTGMPPNGKGSVDELNKAFTETRLRKSAVAEKMRDIEWQQIPKSRWHAQVGWKAEDYFQDAQIVALCRAIEADNVKEMERLIAAGADPKAIGKDGMTPLLWAFPDHKPERFECLLSHDADPNVVFRSNFGVPSRAFHPYASGKSFFPDRGCYAGQTVTHLASRSPVTDYMRLVFASRGEASLVDQKTGDTPLNTVLHKGMPDMQERVEILLKLKADPNHFSQWQGGYPAVQAVRADRLDIALTLLAAGADPTLSKEPYQGKLIDAVAHTGRNAENVSKENSYQALVDELERRGESLREAQLRADARDKK